MKMVAVILYIPNITNIPQYVCDSCSAYMDKKLKSYLMTTTCVPVVISSQEVYPSPYVMNVWRMSTMVVGVRLDMVLGI